MPNERRNEQQQHCSRAHSVSTVMFDCVTVVTAHSGAVIPTSAASPLSEGSTLSESIGPIRRRAVWFTFS